MEFELIADGLRVPEAPVVMDVGSVIVVEFEQGRITRCWSGGRKEVVATPGPVRRQSCGDDKLKATTRFVVGPR